MTQRPGQGLRCPTCRAPVAADGPHRPFCSDRCRMVDLGAWLLGHYRIPAEEPSGFVEDDEPPDTRSGGGGKGRDDDDASL